MPEGHISKAQLRRLQTLCGLIWKRFGSPDDGGRPGPRQGEPGEQIDRARAFRLAFVGGKLGRTLDSFSSLTRSEAKTALDAVQGCLPPELIRTGRRRAPGRELAKSLGTAGRKGHQDDLTMADGISIRKMEDAAAALGWSRQRLDAFIRSRKSPVRGSMALLRNVKRVTWVLQTFLRRSLKHKPAPAPENIEAADEGAAAPDFPGNAVLQNGAVANREIGVPGGIVGACSGCSGPVEGDPNGIPEPEPEEAQV